MNRGLLQLMMGDDDCWRRNGNARRQEAGGRKQEALPDMGKLCYQVRPFVGTAGVSPAARAQQAWSLVAGGFARAARSRRAGRPQSPGLPPSFPPPLNGGKK